MQTVAMLRYAEGRAQFVTCEKEGLMTERSTLIAILTALYLGSRIPDDIGKGAFYALLGLGWAVAFAWIAIAWFRGEKVFIWQNRGS